MASLRAVDVYDENVSEITSWLTKVAMVGTTSFSPLALCLPLTNNYSRRGYTLLWPSGRVHHKTLSEPSQDSKEQNEGYRKAGILASRMSKLRPQTSEIITRSPLGAEGLYCPRDRNSKGRPVVRPTRA
ncbi:hypothetical protein V1478_003984 [Vespula squamosa]|uniref:Uncharacterized protein n=1 Tax=Vespula squamosa TaxID=30214 RepID=A0ABD2BNE4_VESSQ